MSEKSQIEHLEATIKGLEAQRSLLGDIVVQAALQPLREQLAQFYRL